MTSPTHLLTDIFQAYYDARCNKRNTINALAFEMNYEKKLFCLYEDIISRNYTISPSICFINFSPVQREIFAADFRDRVVHHLIYNYIYPIFDKTFINDSYSCRKGKGTHYGIRRIDHFIRTCTENYSKDCYILKLDIRGYFMAMNRSLLFEKVNNVLVQRRNKLEVDFDLLLYLIEKVIFNEPTKNCIIKGRKTDWRGLPKSKSLFYANDNCGLPIGNLTSQLFGNVYMNEFDHYVKRDLGIKYYGRYVDDFILVHPDKEYLKWMIEKMKTYLTEELQLELHPNKIYLQHFSKGVSFLGTVIKPHRIYIANRTKNNFYEAIKKQSEIAIDHKPTKEEKDEFLSSMNSYLGIMKPCKASQQGKHYKTYKLRKKMVFKNLSAWWWNYVYLTGGIAKFELKGKASYSKPSVNKPIMNQKLQA